MEFPIRRKAGMAFHAGREIYRNDDLRSITLPLQMLDTDSDGVYSESHLKSRATDPDSSERPSLP